MTRAVLIACAAALWSCSGARGPAPVPSPATAEPTLEAPSNQAARGRALVEAFQCTSCHEIETLDGEELERPRGGRDCFGCHRSVALGTFDERPHMHEQWKRELPHKFDVPSLRGANRFRRTWLVEYLREPHDVRQNLDSQMPRMPMTREDAEAIADFLGAADRADTVAAGSADRGARYYAAYACATCHAPQPASTVRPAILAPHLAHATRRLGRDGVVGWILDPMSHKADTLMPNFGVRRDEAVDLAAYIETLEPPPLPPPPERLPYRLTRIVPWKEVYRGLLRERCLHCHNRPESSGMGGPGYSGGWGYEGKAQSLFTYDELMKGGRDEDGNRRTLFDPVGSEGLPRVVAHLVARHHEVAGQPTELVGMPLGQPPVPFEQIDALYTWILQGRLP